MTDELPDLPSLRSIDPPPHGLAGLRAAIARDTERRTSRARWILAVVPAAAILLVVLWLRRDREVVVLAEPALVEAKPDLSIAPTFYWVTATPAMPERPGVSYVRAEQLAPITQLP